MAGKDVGGGVDGQRLYPSAAAAVLGAGEEGVGGEDVLPRPRGKLESRASRPVLFAVRRSSQPVTALARSMRGQPGISPLRRLRQKRT